MAVQVRRGLELADRLGRSEAQTASAQRPVEWRRSVDAAGGLVLAPLDLRGLDLERVRGTVVAARALSREICELCGAPGDPVWPAGGRGGTRCAGCRGAGDEVLPRDDAWRRERDPERERRDPDAPRGSYRQYAVLEDDPGFDAVMDAGYHPDDERGWFGNGVQGGWRHLVRAAFTLLVREQAGPRPGRLSQMKEKWGGLRLSWINGTSFHLAVLELVERLSNHVCYMCGRPAQMRGGPWVHPACDPCEARYLADQRRPFGQVRRVLANRRRFQGLASEAERRERRALDGGRCRETPRGAPPPKTLGFIDLTATAGPQLVRPSCSTHIRQTSPASSTRKARCRHRVRALELRCRRELYLCCRGSNGWFKEACQSAIFEGNVPCWRSSAPGSHGGGKGGFYAGFSRGAPAPNPWTGIDNGSHGRKRAPDGSRRAPGYGA